LLKGILSYGLVEGFSKGLNKLVILLLPLLLTTVSFGKLGIIISLELLVPVVLLLGLERAVLRFQSDKNLSLKLLSTVVMVIGLLHLGALFLLILGHFIGINEFFGLRLFPDIFLVLILTYLQGIILVNLNRIRVESKHKEYFKYRLIFQIVKIIVVISLAFLLKNHLAYLIGGIFSSLIILYMIMRNNNFKIGLSFDKAVFLVLVSYSWPFVFHGLAGNLLGTFDRFVIASNLSLLDVAQYTFAYALGSAVAFSFIGLSVYMEPMIYKEDDLKARERLLNNYLMYALIGGSIVTMLITLGANNLVPLFYGKGYEDSLAYLPLIAIGHMFLPFYTIANYKLAYEKKTKSIAVVSFFCALVNVLMNILLVPFIGVPGAAIATIGSYFLMAFIFSIVIRDSKDLFRINMIGILFLTVTAVLVYLDSSFLFYSLSALVILLSLFFKYSKKIKE
jgi:O-antigen/teichoic acid export membrane protein